MTSPTIQDLNKNQKEAVLSEEKRLLVLAGAGSGKTKTLIQKIIYMISEKNVDPSNVLAITFTKNATNEMIDRLILYSDKEGSYKKVLFNKKLPKKVRDEKRREYIKRYPWLSNITVRTFHSLCYMILRQFGAKEFDNKFRILPDKIFDSDIPNKYSANITQLELIHRILYELCDDPEFLIEVKKYLIDYHVDTYRKRMQKRGFPDYEKPYTTLRGENVRSKSEQRIADWLYRYNIDYEYEPLIGPVSFEFKPDFLIKGADLYLEHTSNLSYPLKDKEREMKLSGKTYLRVHEKDMTDSKHFNKLMDSLILKRYDNKFGKIKYLSVEESFKSYGYELNGLLFDFITAIDKIKVEDKDFDKIYKKGLEDKHERVSIFYKILKPLYEGYKETCIRKSLRDFNDLILTCVKLLENHEDIRKVLQDKFKYILVDEFQDVNTIQVKLLKLLLKKDNNLFCVGDDWQSIYGFRGSEIEFIVNFSKYFKNPKLIKLKINYRSNDSFVNASNQVIKNNIYQIEKEIQAFNKSGKKIYLYCSRKESEDGAIEVRKKVKKLLENGYQKEDLLVLSRTTKSDEFSVYREVLRPFGVRVITIHQSKGLEAKVVFIVGLHGGRYGFPNVREADRIFQLIKKSQYELLMEEERRLFYVALTRAKEELFLISEVGNESEFIQEIPGEFLDRSNFLILNIKAQLPIKCKSCKSDIDRDSKFCKFCGEDILTETPKETKKKRIIEDLKHKPKKAFTMEEIRKEYPNAYVSWTKEEEEKLTKYFKQGKKISEIAKLHGRKPGGIRSRLIRLGLIE